MRDHLGRISAFFLLLLSISIAQSATVNVDLDRNGTNESSATLTVITSSPCKVSNTVTNKTSGQAFRFGWPFAGPGGFFSEAGNAAHPGTAAGVGATWTWQTNQIVSSFTGSNCNDDLCFTRTYPTAGTQFGSFRAPGRRLASGATPTSQTLTFNLLTFFSRPVELVRVISSARRLANGQFLYLQQVKNLSSDTIFVDLAPGPLDCGLDCGEFETNCDGICTDTSSDDNNCGECGVVCDYPQFCSGGECVSDLGLTSGVSRPQPTIAGEVICDFDGASDTLSPGEVLEICDVSLHPPMEVTSQLNACGGAIPDGGKACSNAAFGSQGPVNLLVPDPSVSIGSQFLSIAKIVAIDPSGTGVPQAGSSAELHIFLSNAGTQAVSGITDAVLTALPFDLDGDPGNEVASILQGHSGYPTIPGNSFTGGGSCADRTVVPPNPVRNSTPYLVSFPTDPIDVAYPLNLHVEETRLSGVSFTADLSFVVGVRGGCSVEAGPAGDFDLVQGLLPPMAGLVPEVPASAEAAAIPTPSPFKAGRTLPLKLKFSCGGVNLTDALAEAPEIAALERLVPGGPNVPVPISGVGPDTGNLFRFTGDGGHWWFDLKTTGLLPGKYVIKILMPNGAIYEAGFVIRGGGPGAASKRISATVGQ